MIAALIRGDDRYRGGSPEASKDEVSDSLVPAAMSLASSPVCDQQTLDLSENKRQLP